VGGRVSGQWLGKIETSLFVRSFNLDPKRRYRFELIFSDPTYDYNQLKRAYKRKLSLSLGSISRSRLIVGHSELNEIEGIVDNLYLPNIPALSGILAGMPNWEKKEIMSLSGSVNDRNFPPFYSKVCDSNGKKCRNASLRDHLILAVDFNLKEEDGQLIPHNMVFERKSKLLKGYKEKADIFPGINCN